LPPIGAERCCRIVATRCRNLSGASAPDRCREPRVVRAPPSRGACVQVSRVLVGEPTIARRNGPPATGRSLGKIRIKLH